MIKGAERSSDLPSEPNSLISFFFFFFLFFPELSDENNGKASVLVEATRVVKDMLAQIDSLKKENAALFSESQYVSPLMVIKSFFFVKDDS